MDFSNASTRMALILPSPPVYFGEDEKQTSEPTETASKHNLASRQPWLMTSTLRRGVKAVKYDGLESIWDAYTQETFSAEDEPLKENVTPPKHCILTFPVCKQHRALLINNPQRPRCSQEGISVFAFLCYLCVLWF